MVSATSAPSTAHRIRRKTPPPSASSIRALPGITLRISYEKTMLLDQAISQMQELLSAIRSCPNSASSRYGFSGESSARLSGSTADRDYEAPMDLMEKKITSEHQENAIAVAAYDRTDALFPRQTDHTSHTTHSIRHISNDYQKHQACDSCGTTETPYWREAWKPAVTLCNACGLRLSKMRRYCAGCSYVPRKKSCDSRHCPRCFSTFSLR